MAASPTPNTLRIGLLAAALLGLAACASGPPRPDDELAQADVAITRAESAGAQREAPLELQAARDKLSDARDQVAEEKYQSARRLAEEAAADADLARARAEAATAERGRESVDTTIRTLATPPAGTATSSPSTQPLTRP